MARCIDDPWFASQALAWVARFAPESSVAGLAAESQRRADLCADDYKRSAVRAWPIRALVERGHDKEARKDLSAAITIARRATPSSSRSEAFFLLFQAAYPLGAAAVSPLADLLFETWHNDPHWRCERCLVNSLSMLSVIDAARLEALKKSCPASRIFAKVNTSIQRGLTAPRSFFW
jgi:hypothetical protein